MTMSSSGGAVMKLADINSRLFDLRAQGGTLYMAAVDGVYSMSRLGGPVTALTQGFVNERLAIDATHVYYPGLNTVMKVPLDGGPPEMIVPSANTAYAIVVDQTSVYFSSADGIIKVTPK